MEKTIESWQRGAIFSNAGKLGISRNSHEDELHILIEGLSGKTSIKELTFQEANIIIDELKKRAVSSLNAAPAKKRVHPTVPGGVTSQQQGKIWALMYELIKYDTKPVQAPVGKRLCGLIKKQFNIDAPLKEPFRFLSCENGREMIEALRHILTNLELRRLRDGGGRNE